jgi:hypothetical protein
MVNVTSGTLVASQPVLTFKSLCLRAEDLDKLTELKLQSSLT